MGHGHGRKVSVKAGSAGKAQTRTSWDHSLILAILSSRRGAVPYIVHPLLFPSGIIARIISRPADQSIARSNARHPCHLALEWRQQIERGYITNDAETAAREGILRARVTQLMNLLLLSRAIQNELQSPPAPPENHAFSERQLRSLLSKHNPENQLKRRREWVQGLLRT